MPSSFFAFQQGSDSRSLPPPDAESLRYGRFRAFSPAHKSSVNNLFSLFAAGHSDSEPRSAGYGSINIATGHEAGEEEVDEPDNRWWLDRELISPRRKVVQRLVGCWWRRWAVLVVLPAVIVCLTFPRARTQAYWCMQSIIWCMIPFPTYPLPAGDKDVLFAHSVRFREAVINTEHSAWSHLGDAIRNVFDFGLLWEVIKNWCNSIRDSVPSWPGEDNDTPNIPGHGSSQVAMNFWFFLFVYYGFYNLVGLLWITKIFNMYSLNWWPPTLGFPVCHSVPKM
jgi:hypothetical protein